MNKRIENTRTGYHRVAAEYSERFKDELDDKPIDRDCLDWFSRKMLSHSFILTGETQLNGLKVGRSSR
jgi:hypothetical protein